MLIDTITPCFFNFVDLYKRNYLDVGNFTPIYAQARESTSYGIIIRHLDKIAADLGVKFELEELETYNKGKDTMHPVVITPRPLKK